MNALDKNKILLAVSPDVRKFLQELIILSVVDSTNEYLKKLAKQSAISGIVCIAEQQTAGKGQLGKKWLSPRGKNIYLSVLIDSAANHNCCYENFSLVIAVAVIRTLQQLRNKPLDIMIKWPNDIFCQDCKIAGVLIETVKRNNNLISFIIGVGINIQLSPEEKAQIGQPAIGLEEITSNKIDRNNLVGILLSEILLLAEDYQNHGFKCCLNEWRQYDLLLNKKITLKSGNKIYTGVAKGITSTGTINVLINNELKAFNSGEIQLLKRLH